jgi:hypothetical protein
MFSTKAFVFSGGQPARGHAGDDRRRPLHPGIDFMKQFPPILAQSFSPNLAQMGDKFVGQLKEAG